MGITIGILLAFGVVAFLEYTDNAIYKKIKSWIKAIPDPNK